jgi:hypothetical protein
LAKIKAGKTNIIKVPRDPPRMPMTSAIPGTYNETIDPVMSTTTPADIRKVLMGSESSLGVSGNSGSDLRVFNAWTKLTNALAVGLVFIGRPKKIVKDNIIRHIQMSWSSSGYPFKKFCWIPRVKEAYPQIPITR